MSTFLHIFSNNILPVFITIGIGFLLDRTSHIDKKTLSRVTVYVFSPCLVFATLVKNTADPRDFAMMMVFATALHLVMIVISMLVGRLLGWDARRRDALVLVSSFLNAGNLGLSVVLLSFGEDGLALAMAYFVISNLMNNTFGAFFAARGGGQGGVKDALKKVVRLPSPYAFILGYGLSLLHLEVPSQILTPLATLGNAALPTMLLMLGIQLGQTKLNNQLGDVSIGVFLRLVASAGVAALMAPLFGLTGVASQVAIMESATPTAVTTSLLAIEFDADADYVVSVIFGSTLLSAITLTVVLALLQ